jgi:hypothetical protein
VPSHDDEREPSTLGRIALKQVRVRKAESAGQTAENPQNRLVPYLDLFARLDDAQLGRLADVDPDAVRQLRLHVVQVERALMKWVDLLPRLSDEELARLTGASIKTLRFWRLCQPRTGPGSRAAAGPGRAAAASASPRRAPEPSVDRTPATRAPAAPLGPGDSGAAPFPGFESHPRQPDEGGDISLADAEGGTWAAARADDDDLEFELSDDDFA